MAAASDPATRRSFVVHVHVEGMTTLEDVQSRDRRMVKDLAAVPGQIESWLNASASDRGIEEEQ